MIYTLTLFNWMRNTKTDTPINGPNLKNDTQFKEKTKPYEFKETHKSAWHRFPNTLRNVLADDFFFVKLGIYALECSLV